MRPTKLEQLASEGTWLSDSTSALQLKSLLRELQDIFGGDGACCYMFDTTSGRFYPAEHHGQLAPILSTIAPFSRLDSEDLPHEQRSRVRLIARALEGRRPVQSQS